MRPFSATNLLSDPGAFGPCDVVFCRNVFLYIDAATVRTALESLAAIIPPDGFLVIGGSETLLGSTDHFAKHPRQPGVLVRRMAESDRRSLKLAVG